MAEGHDIGSSRSNVPIIEAQGVSVNEDDNDKLGKSNSTSTSNLAQTVEHNNGTMNGKEFQKKHIRIAPYEGETQMQSIMNLIDGELSEPYTVYTYRYFLNQWPELCFLAHYSANPYPESRQTKNDSETAIGVVIGKLDKHLKGNRYMRGYIGMVSIRSDFRGKGIATSLLQTLLQKMVKQGAQEIVLETEIDNVASLQLYEKLGFIREKRLFNFYLNGKDCFRLIAEIPKSLWNFPNTPPPTQAGAMLQSQHHQQQQQQSASPAHAFADLRITPPQPSPTSPGPSQKGRGLLQSDIL